MHPRSLSPGLYPVYDLLQNIKQTAIKSLPENLHSQETNLSTTKASLELILFK